MKSAIQLYSIRAIDEPYLDLLDRVGETTFDGVEFAKRADEASPADVKQRLADNDLEAAAAHVGIEALEEEFDEVVARATDIGYEHVVIPWIDPEHWQTVDAVEETARRVGELADEVAAEGLTLHYHNHDQEFAETEEGTAFDLFAEQVPNLRLEVDAGWALAGGADPIEVIERYGDRITLVHMKDVYTEMSGTDEFEAVDVPALGEGDLDLDAVAEAAHAVDAEWLVYENDLPADPVTALSHGARLLDRYV